MFILEMILIVNEKLFIYSKLINQAKKFFKWVLVSPNHYLKAKLKPNKEYSLLVNFILSEKSVNIYSENKTPY